MFYFLTRPSGVTVYVDQDVTNLDLFTLFGNPNRARTWTLIINTNVLVRSTNTANAAIYSSQNLPAGSLLKIINKGCIHGMGGAGGDFTTYVGSSGGNALNLSCKTIIANSLGYIFGGGGGGGSISGGFGSTFYVSGGGGSGGGGGLGVFQGGTRLQADNFGTYGYIGVPGISYTQSVTSVWSLISGIGGVYGSNGTSSYTDINGVITLGYIGGLAGAAVKLNNFELTFLSGLDANHVKGSYTTN